MGDAVGPVVGRGRVLAAVVAIGNKAIGWWPGRMGDSNGGAGGAGGRGPGPVASWRWDDRIGKGLFPGGGTCFMVRIAAGAGEVGTVEPVDASSDWKRSGTGKGW